MAEGSEAREREHELDLGQGDDISLQLDHGAALDDDRSGPSPQELIEEEEELDTIDDNAQDQTSQKTPIIDSLELPETPPPQRTQLNAYPGSVDETASTPDDTPSLHVSSRRPSRVA